MPQEQGKFIVIYGINNLGKTTQAKMLVERLCANGFKAEYLKYPIYDLEPSGKVINNYLREGNFFNLNARSAQIIYTLNRTQYEPELRAKLDKGINIIAEDYVGTGLAWGMGAGVNEYFLKKINSHLLKEDLAFLFDGNRFRQATEAKHKHENDDDLINKVRWAHLKLAQEYNWIKINANLSQEEIHEQIWSMVSELIITDVITQKSHFFISKSSPLQGEVAQVTQTEGLENIQKKSPQTLKVERLSSTAKLPTRAHYNDAGMDLYSADYYSILPGERVLVKTGIKMAIPNGFVGLIWDKSGIARDGIHTLAGVIDAGYRGEILVNLTNLGHDIYHIAPGQKIAQILIQKIELPEIIEAKLDKTERDSNGFGSTGLF